MIDTKEFRHVLGHYPSGLVIVTASTPNGPVGMTLQCFHSLSMDPPLVALFAGKSSSTWPQLAEAGRFCANVLAADQAELAGRFGRRDGERFAGLTCAEDAFGAPMIPGAQAHISCRLVSVVDGGDHHIAIAAIEALAADSQARPLVYYRGGFHQIASAA